MDKPTESNYPGQPTLPAWSLSGTHVQLFDLFEQTLVILEIYERNLSALMDEFKAVEDSSKAEEVVTKSRCEGCLFSIGGPGSDILPEKQG